MFEATCHCGAVRLGLPSLPDAVTRCNCTICVKIGALWTYFSPSSVEMIDANKKTSVYMWGDRSIQIRHCPTCGCLTHWTPVSGGLDRMGVNARMIDGLDLAGLPVQEFDGASM